MKTKIQVRRDTAANWTSNNPTLSAGEIGFESNTGKFKIGTGALAWTSLAYAAVLPSDLDELSQDAVNSALTAGTGILKAYNDGANTITLEVDTNVIANKTYVDTSISNLIDGAPNLLNTLNELAAAVNDDPTFFTTVATNLSNHESDTTNIHGISNTADLVTLSGTQTLTNKSISGSSNTFTNIPNNALSNSSITINGFPISLGGTAEYSTDNIQQGATNKYFSDELAQDAVAQALANGTHTNISVSYNDNSNAISLTGAVTYTDENAVDAVATALGNGTHTNISVSYNDGANSISLTGADPLPAQTSNSGKFLSTNGTNDSWEYVKIPTGTSESASPSEGQFFFNINANALKIYAGGAWLTVGQVSMEPGSPYTTSYDVTYDAGSPDIEPTIPVFDGASVA